MYFPNKIGETAPVSIAACSVVSLRAAEDAVTFRACSATAARVTGSSFIRGSGVIRCSSAETQLTKNANPAKADNIFMG
jgi:hypothetical protein